MTAKAQAVLDRIEALRQLETTTGVRAQRNLLLTLSDDELAEVSLEVAKLSRALCTSGGAR